MARMSLLRIWIDKITSLPETGMGYHKVKILLKDGTVINGMVYNSEILETSMPIRSEEIKDIKPR